MFRKFVKISREQAERRYENGETIQLCPSKLRPGNPFGCYTEINVSCDGDFETFVREFAFYNCTDEVGEELAFYAEQKQGNQYVAAYPAAMAY